MPPEETKEEIKIEEPEINSTEEVEVNPASTESFSEAKQDLNNENPTEAVVSESMKPEESPLSTSLPEEIPPVSSKSELQSVEASVMEQNTESVPKSDGLKEYLSENKSYVSRLLDRANVALNTKR